MALEADDWKPLAYPSENERVVDAGALKKWLREIYPSGIMERVDPATKRVYAIRAAEGSLSLVPAGDHEDYRFAILSGKVTLTDEGPDDFSYTGDLQAVILYGPPEDGVLSVRGGFEGTYPRRDPRQKRPRILPLRAVFESLPE